MSTPSKSPYLETRLLPLLTALVLTCHVEIKKEQVDTKDQVEKVHTGKVTKNSPKEGSDFDSGEATSSTDGVLDQCQNEGVWVCSGLNQGHMLGNREKLNDQGRTCAFVDLPSFEFSISRERVDGALNLQLTLEGDPIHTFYWENGQVDCEELSDFGVALYEELQKNLTQAVDLLYENGFKASNEKCYEGNMGIASMTDTAELDDSGMIDTGLELEAPQNLWTICIQEEPLLVRAESGEIRISSRITHFDELISTLEMILERAPHTDLQF